MYDVSVHQSLDDLGRDRWDALHPRDFSLSSHWLGTVAGAMPKASYLLVQDEQGGSAAGAVLYRVGADEWTFQNPARLALGEGLRADFEAGQPDAERERCEELREAVGPRLLERFPAAVCVVPYAYEPALCVAPGGAGALSALMDALDGVAVDWGAKSRAVLYLGGADGDATADALGSRRYLPMTIGARCILPVWWRDFDGYLGRLRRRRRWTVKQELRGFADSRFELEIAEGSCLGEIAEQLAYLSARQMEKYGHGFDVAKEEFTLKLLRENVARFVRLFLVRRDDQIVAYSLYYQFRDRLQIAFAAQDYDEVGPRDFAHFMSTYYAPICYAGRIGAQEIDFGLGAYRTKAHRGCVLRPLRGFFDFGAAPDRELAELLALQDRANRAFLEGHRPPLAQGMEGR